MLKGSRKTIVLIATHALVESDTKGFTSCKSQCKKNIDNVKRARKIREVQLRELEEDLKMRRAMHVVTTGDFNESVYSTNMQNFMTETGLFDVFQEVNGVEMEQRDAAFEHGSKHADFSLTTEGILICVSKIELIDCNEIVE